MVDLDIRAEGFSEGGTRSAVSGHYRFRRVQVSRPAALSTFQKITPREAVSQVGRRVRRNLRNRSGAALTGRCAAQ